MRCLIGKHATGRCISAGLAELTICLSATLANLTFYCCVCAGSSLVAALYHVLEAMLAPALELHFACEVFAFFLRGLV